MHEMQISPRNRPTHTTRLHITNNTTKQNAKPNKPKLSKYKTNYPKSTNIKTPPTIRTIIFEMLYMNTQNRTLPSKQINNALVKVFKISQEIIKTKIKFILFEFFEACKN